MISWESGAIAVIEHGLPVIVHDDEDTPYEKLFVNNEFSEQILLNDEELSVGIIYFQEKKPFFDGVAYTIKK